MNSGNGSESGKESLTVSFGRTPGIVTMTLTVGSKSITSVVSASGVPDFMDHQRIFSWTPMLVQLLQLILGTEQAGPPGPQDKVIEKVRWNGYEWWVWSSDPKMLYFAPIGATLDPNDWIQLNNRVTGLFLPLDRDVLRIQFANGPSCDLVWNGKDKGDMMIENILR